MPLDVNNFDQHCKDMYEQYKSGVTGCILFAMTLVPEGNPVTMHLNNNYYSQVDTKYFTHAFCCAATEIAKTKNKVDVYISETDTCSQNRYSTSAMSIHTHFTGSIMEGVKDGKYISDASAYILDLVVLLIK